MRIAIVPASMLAEPPPFQRRHGVPRTTTSWAPADWCGSDRAVVEAEALVRRAAIARTNAQTRLEEARAQHDAALAQAESMGYALIKR